LLNKKARKGPRMPVKKIAFPHWDNRIAPVFDTARRIVLIEVQRGRIIKEEQGFLPEKLPVSKVIRLLDMGVGVLVCGAISRPMHALVSAYGITVVPFVAGGLREVIDAWLRGRLTQDAFSMPGCRRRGRRGHRVNMWPYY
jgi:predicted Fe-Mo cluster-binding NifX family protein